MEDHGGELAVPVGAVDRVVLADHKQAEDAHAQLPHDAQHQKQAHERVHGAQTDHHAELCELVCNGIERFAEV